MKLTKDSVGKVYRQKNKEKVVKIVSELPEGSMFDFVGVSGCGETNFYMANGYQGRYGQGGYDLVLPARTWEEIMGDMVTMVKFGLKQGWCSADRAILVEEAEQLLGGVKDE